MLKRFAYHGITVSDMERSIAFYRGLLGMKIDRTYEASGDPLEKATGLRGAHISAADITYQDDLGDHRVKLVQWLSPAGRKVFEKRLCDVGASHSDLSLDRAQEVYDELSGKNVKFISPPVHPILDHPERMFTYMLDPDGNVIELHRRVPHHAHVVSDLDPAIAFYRDNLGMKLDCILDIKNPAISQGTGFPDTYIRSGHMIIDAEEYVELHHYIRPEGKKTSDLRPYDVGWTWVAFEVDNVQQEYEALRTKGVRFMSAPVQLAAVGSEVKMVNLLDPDGYQIELDEAT